MKKTAALLFAAICFVFNATNAQFTEDFESGIFPPTNWQESHSGVDALDQSMTQAHGGTYSALFDDVTGTDSSILISDYIANLSANSQLIFWEYQNFDTYYLYHAVWIQVNAGALTELINLGPGVVSPTLTPLAGAASIWEKKSNN